jgi:dihydroorotase
LSEPRKLEYDVVLRGAHVIDPSQDIDRVMEVGLRNGTIAALGEHLDAQPECVVRDLAGKFLCPGLIDLHGHWYQGSAYGLDPQICLNHGVTTAVDAGTAGYVNFPEFVKHNVADSPVRLLAFVNIAALGIPVAFAGELEDIRYARPAETAEIIQRHAGVALGVKVRQGSMVGSNGEAVMTMALEAAEECRLPIMVHISAGADTPAILRRLRTGDIVTHCYQGRGDGLLINGRLEPEALAARKEGVLFDVGHGCGSFSWDAARKAFERFFLPDTISTDLHRFSVERWAIDLPTTMSKFLHLGMSLNDIVRKTTVAPAHAIGRADESGSLRLGAKADIFIFALEEGEFLLEDTHFKIEKASRRIKSEFVIRDGTMIECGSVAASLRPLAPCDRQVFDFLERTAQDVHA